MELDDLKKSWKKIGENAEPYKREQVLEAMKNSSKSPLVKMRKSMFIEMGILLLCVGGLYAIYFSKSFNTSLLALYSLGFFTAVLIFFTFYFYSRVLKNTKTISLNGPVAEQLRTNIDLLESDISFYRNLNLILYVPAVFIGILISNKTFIDFNSLFNGEVSYWVVIAIITLLLFPLYYGFVKFWIRKFYGKYLDELKTMYKEITE